jgi:hypothetical protein
MGCSTLKKLVIVVLVIVVAVPAVCVGSDVRPEVDVLMDVRNALDPQGRVLVSWKQDVSPCSGSFEGILCGPGECTALSFRTLGYGNPPRTHI